METIYVPRSDAPVFEPAAPTREQARLIICSYLQRDVDVHISSVEIVPTHGFSAFTDLRSFVVGVQEGDGYSSLGDKRFILRTSTSEPPTASGVYAPNHLATEHRLLTLLPPSIPHATPFKLDVSLTIVPFSYLLLSYVGGVPLAEVKQKGQMSERQTMLLDLRLGSYFKTLHETVQNDWFGLPSQDKDELYSWQEAFVWLLEDLLHEAQSLPVNVELPFESIRRYLSRAIGSFLFDDVEVPSLISFTGDDYSVFVALPANEEEEIQVTSLVPLSHALWGDPLLETVFMTEDDNAPSPAFLEGYGGSPIVFLRQRTKRMWYTLFLALTIVVMKARKSETEDNTTSGEGNDQENEKVLWARDALGRYVEKLKDAPCY